MSAYNLYDAVDVIGLIDLVLTWDLPEAALPDAFQAQIVGAYLE